MFNFIKTIHWRPLVLSLILSFFLINSFLFINPVHAADNCIKLQVPLPGIGDCVKDFPTYIKTIYNFFIGIIGILAVIMIMVGGFQWLLAAGNSQKIAGAKTTILSAIMGLVLALTSYTILYILNPDLLNLEFNPTQVSLKPATAESYCTSNKGIFLFNDDYAMCGKIYQLREQKNGQDVFCTGFVCDPTVDFNKYICLKYEDNLSCVNSIHIDDKQWGHGSNDWTLVPNINPVSCRYDCGVLAYCGSIIKNRVVGGMCPSGEYCFIDASKGAEFTKKYTKLPLVDTKVGKLLGAECKSYNMQN